MEIVRSANGCGHLGRAASRSFDHRRRWLPLVLALTLAGTGLSAAPGRVAAEGAAIVDAELLNLRAEPGTWAWVSAQMGSGEAVTLLSGPTPDGWYLVQYSELTGWAHGAFLRGDGAPGWEALQEQPDRAAAGAGWAAPDVAFALDPVAVDDAASGSAWTNAAAQQAWVDPAGAAPAAATGPTLGVGGMGATAWVNQDDLMVLAAPNDQSAVVDLLGAGDAVTVTGAPVAGFVPIEHWAGEAWIWNGAIATGAPAGPERWADVSRSAQTVTLYEGDQIIASYWGAMGVDGSDGGFFSTANGSFRVYEKYADLSWTTYGNAWVSDWVAFDPNRLNGFHSYSMDWSGQVIPGGDGPTGGCVALAPWAADHLFSFLELGSRVEVHW